MSEEFRELRVGICDAFADEPLAGNPAGVVQEADGLSAAQMRAIAREINASETAFLVAGGAADRRIRYFTPTTEVDLCGHATIASHAYLYGTGAIDAGTHALETNVGVLDVEVEAGGTVWMTQAQPTVREVGVAPGRVADALGIEEAALVLEELPLAYASTGLPFLVVPVDFLSSLGSAEPDMDALAALSSELEVEGVYAFTFDALEADSTLHGRMWAPLAGVPEDPVTGTASGAVGAYLRHAGAFDGMPEELVFEQGHYVDRPGRVRVRVGEDVRVGGRAVVALEGTLAVPDDEPDDIIEV